MVVWADIWWAIRSQRVGGRRCILDDAMLVGSVLCEYGGEKNGEVYSKST